MGKLNKLVKTVKKESEIIKGTKWTTELVDKTDKIESTEDLANTMLAASHQFNLLSQSILQQKFGFTDKDLNDFNRELAHSLESLAYFETKGLHPLSLHSLNEVVDITMNNYQKIKAARAGLTLPTDKDAAKLLYGKKK